MTTFLKSFSLSVLKKLSFSLLLVTGLEVGAWIIWPPPPAEANIGNFLFGRRQNRGGRSPNRQRGGGVRAGRISGGLDPHLPYVITPRNTFQPSDQFTIRWQAVEGATTYTVRLWQWEDANGGRQRVVWQTTTADSSVVYSGNPPLLPESFYSVQVITDQGVSSDLDAGCAMAGFALLFPETQSRLQADLTALDRTDLSAADLALAEAEVYLDYQMLDAAIATLANQLALTPTDTLYLALGDLYSLTGLNALAMDHYTQGLDLATANQNELWRAIALEGLGEVHVLSHDLTAAMARLRQAELSYRLADVPRRANQLRQRVELLEKAQQLGLFPMDDPAVCATAQ